METCVLSKPATDEIELERLFPPCRTLRPLDESIIAELSASIRGVGLLQPIVARKCGSKYEVVFGCHRLEACRRLGMKAVPVYVSQMDDSEAFLARVTENLARNNYVNPIEEAEGYRVLVKSGWTINAIAKKIGKCDSYVSERIGLLDHLDKTVLAKVGSGGWHISPSHAELIARVGDLSKQRQLAEFVHRKRLSVRTLENMLRATPFPTTVIIRQELNGECSVIIPTDFLVSLQFEPGDSLQIYVRGRTLVLDKPAPRRRKRMHSATATRLHNGR
jgi:ParB/RepB/Spo0J family partition protein